MREPQPALDRRSVLCSAGWRPRAPWLPTFRAGGDPQGRPQIGWGWGANDAGDNPGYQNRGLYAYQPVYPTRTTLRNTEVTGAGDQIRRALARARATGVRVAASTGEPRRRCQRWWAFPFAWTGRLITWLAGRRRRR
jgi:hypothetical protein